MPLYILPFDHRSMFIKNIFGWHYPLTHRQHATVESYKHIIFQGFVRARKEYLKHGKSEDLVFFIDEEFGSSIIRDAKKQGIVFSVALEKSGGIGFDFAYDKSYKEHLKKIKPPFAKALVHYQNGMGNLDAVSIRKLKDAINYCRRNEIATVIEIVLIPSKEMTSSEALRAFDQFVRPRLTVKIIREIIKSGITPTVWKLEPQPTKLAWKKVIKTVNHIPIVVLGAGKSLPETELSFALSACFPEIIGFAIGRTVFQEPLVEYHQKNISKSDAIKSIADSFLRLIIVWEGEKQKVHTKK